MQGFNKDELAKIGAEALAFHKDVDKVYVTDDGYVFKPANYENLKDYTRKLGIGYAEHARPVVAAPATPPVVETPPAVAEPAASTEPASNTGTTEATPPASAVDATPTGDAGNGATGKAGK